MREHERRRLPILVRCSHCTQPGELIPVVVSIGISGPLYRELCATCCAALQRLFESRAAVPG